MSRNGIVPITVVGNLTGDPELRFTPDGVAVCRFTVAVNPRRPDGAGGWTDGEPSFYPCTAWRDLAEHVAESLTGNPRVIVSGVMAERRWEQDGQKRSRMEITADAVGPDLTYATATVKKMTRRPDTAPDDPWATASRTRPAASAAEPGA